MKKFITLIAMVMIATGSMFAQSARDLAAAQAEDNAFYRKLLNMKPTKDAKKQAKQLQGEGWTVPAGDKGIEMQITASQYYAEELMLDEDGNRTKRYIQQNGISTSGSYNAGYAAARLNAQVEIAAMIKTEIAAAMQTKLDNSQSSGISALTVDKFNERSKAIVDESLTNSIPVIAMYRRLANNNFEVQVRLAFDKKELMARMQRKLKKELEDEGDELKGIVDDIICKKL